MRSNKWYPYKKMSTSEHVKNISLIDHKAYVYFRENSKLCDRRLMAHYVEYSKVMTLFYNIASEKLVDSKGGLYLENFGYFGFLKYFGNYKKYMKHYVGDKIKLKTEEDIYYTTFIPISKNRKLMMYNMDSSFTDNFKARLIEKLNQGYHYMFNASLFIGTKTVNFLRFSN